MGAVFEVFNILAFGELFFWVLFSCFFVWKGFFGGFVFGWLFCLSEKISALFQDVKVRIYSWIISFTHPYNSFI